MPGAPIVKNSKRSRGDYFLRRAAFLVAFLVDFFAAFLRPRFAAFLVAFLAMTENSS